MDKEQKAIERMRLAAQMSETYYQKPLIVTTSGGKDSDVCIALAVAAGIDFEVQHNHTTADAPETVYHVRDTFRRLEAKGIKCTVNWPTYKGAPVTMWSLIPQKLMPPTRVVRYCCSVLKEGGGAGRMITTGVRWAESAARKNKRGIYESMPHDLSKKIIINNDNDDKRQLFENCRLQAKRICNPIVDWRDSDVWEYIRSERLELNPLYDMGFYRVGCLGCPMAGKNRWTEFRLFPTYQRAYIRSFGKMLDVIHAGGGKTKWKTAEDVFSWWMEEETIEGQISLFDRIEWLGEKDIL